MDENYSVETNELRVGPNSQRQVEFFASSEYEVLFGGSAGSGKSLCLVLDPLQYIAYSNYVATIFRRTYPQLLKSIVPYCQQYYPAAGGNYNEQKKTWLFPSGAQIRLGVMEHEEEWQNFQGDETCGQYFDELTTFHWKQYKMLATWNRSKVPGIPPYRRATSNPGGVSHAQVRAHFVDTCEPIKDGPLRYSALAEMWWQPVRPGPTHWEPDERGKLLSRRYIPARVFDNEDVLRNNPNYLSQLLQLPPEKRKAYLEGRWDLYEGMFFGQFSSEIHVIDPLTPAFVKSVPLQAIRGGLDYGMQTVLEVALRDYEGNIVNFLEVYTEKQTPTERFEAMAAALLEAELHNIMIRYDTNMDYSLQYYTGYDKSPISIAREVFARKMGKKAPTLAVVSKKSEDNRKYRAACNEAFKELLFWEKDSAGLFIRKPRWYATRNCKQLIKDIPELIHDPDSPSGLDFEKEGASDHSFDSAKMNFMDLRTPQKKEKPLPYKDADEYMQKEVFEKIHERAARGEGRAHDKL